MRQFALCHLPFAIRGGEANMKWEDVKNTSTFKMTAPFKYKPKYNISGDVLTEYHHPGREPMLM